ncbi:MAG TPA: M1 family metallopeptidase [Anaerolineaceae bacterium]|nr:M1 family metallopeptidase [Anaerolineaceae bacterium]
MKNSPLLIFFLAAALILSACSGSRSLTPAASLPAPQVLVSSEAPDASPTSPTDTTPSTAETPAAPTAQTPQPLMLPAPENRTHYQLNLILNYYTQYAVVDETITYTNRSSQPFSELTVVVPPKYYPGSFSLRSLTDSSGSPISGWQEDGVRFTIPLQTPLTPGESTSLNFSYQLNLPKKEGTFGVSGRQTNLMNWYPYIPPYEEGTGWIIHPQQVENNMVVGEHMVTEMADFDVSLQLTDRQELIEVAASAPAEEKNGVRHYHLELARGFSFSVSDSYFEHEIIQDGVRIHSYVFMEAREAGKAVTEIAAQALKLFGELYFPYPREMISIVAADFLHNMEMDGMVMISYGVFDFYNKTPKTNLTILTPHEISHQWFYSMVGNDQAKEPWLDEALATYHEVLYYQTYQPDLVQWWWNNRIDGFAPKGYVNSDIYLIGGYPAYRDAVYLRGAQFLQELRDLIGDEAFFAALKDYALTNTYKLASGEDFFAAIARHSQQDLSPLLAKYFRN